MAMITDINVRDFAQKVAEIKSLGGEVSPKFEQIVERFNSFVNENAETVQQDILSTITDGRKSTENMAVLKMRFVSAKNRLSNDDYRPIAGPVLDLLREEYGKVADKNYSLLAAQFNEAAETLREYISLVSLETVVDDTDVLAEHLKEPYNGVPKLANRLDALEKVLNSAYFISHRYSPKNEERLGLVVDLDATPKRYWRAVYAAYDTVATNRAGKWGSLITAGAVIKARPLSEVTLAAPLPAIEIKYVQERRGPIIASVRKERDPLVDKEFK